MLVSRIFQYFSMIHPFSKPRPFPTKQWSYGFKVLIFLYDPSPFKLILYPSTNLPATPQQLHWWQDMALNDGRPPDAAVGPENTPKGGKGETSTQTNHQIVGVPAVSFRGVDMTKENIIRYRPDSELCGGVEGEM